MVKLNFVILCNDAFITRGTNSLNIIGIFDRIGVEKLPAKHGKFVVVTNISGDVGKYDQVIIVKNVIKKEEIAKLSVQLEIKEKGGKAQFIGNFLNVEFYDMGKYIIEVYINNKKQDTEVIFSVE